ncbi:MAG: NIL domain-containing protein [bacterium]
MAAAKKKTGKPVARGKALRVKDPLVSRPLELDFPARLVGLPVIYELVKRFDLVPNIKRANVTQVFGYIQLELKGRASAMEAAMLYLQKTGVGVSPIEKDVVES